MLNASHHDTSRRAPHVMIVGAGVVGFATGQGLRDNGLTVTFVDVAEPRVAELRDLGFDAITTEEMASRQPDFYLISVPTPTSDGHINLDAVRAASIAIGQALRLRQEWSCVVVRSTAPPGTTDDTVRSLLERESGKIAGRDFGLGMNPEFLRAATALDDFLDPRVIVLGALDAETEVALRWLYEPWSDRETVVMSNREAEATKYTANLFNAAKISFFNELHDAFKGLGIDSTVPFQTAAKGAEGLWNPRYGIRGGEPFGGVCLPKDTAGFVSFGRELGIDLRILEAVVETNIRLGGQKLLNEVL